MKQSIPGQRGQEHFLSKINGVTNFSTAPNDILSSITGTVSSWKQNSHGLTSDSVEFH